MSYPGVRNLHRSIQSLPNIFLDLYTLQTKMAAFVHGKTFIIAGGSSGTGFAVASILLDAGANVALYTTNQDDGSAFLSSLSDDKRTNALVRGLKITNRQSIKLFLQEAKSKFGKVHGCANITNTAGRRLGQEEIWEVDQDQYELFMDTNVRSCFNLLAEITKPGYLEEPSSIVHVSSVCGEEGFLMGSVYSASEHAAIGLVKSAALEVGTRGIRVNIVTT